MSIDDIVQKARGHRPGNPTKKPRPKGSAVESELLEQAIAKLRAIHARRREDGELMRLIQSQDDVLRNYQPLFRPDGIADITAEQFRSFLNFDNNCHWTSLTRLGGVANDMRKLRKALGTLVDESKPLTQRLDSLFPNGKPKIPRLAQAILTPILLVAYPDKYGVWNGRSSSALKKLGIWPSFRPKRFSGANYAYLNELLLKIAKGVGVDLWTLDALLWRVENEAVNPVTEHSLVALLDELLKSAKTHAVLLYGPAGTGKTYAATQLVEAYGGVNGGRVAQVQFHPAYAYEDFMEGLRPERGNDGQVSYEVKNGVFKEFCTKARTRPDENHLFIIDEINRGNVPKVMGELMYALEYRDTQLKLPYSGEDEEFSIPDNVHILGTMNSSDRSVAMLDVALRRRFHFVELPPQPDLLDGIEVEGGDIELGRLLTALNERILTNKGRHHLLGHSYFLPRRYPDEKEISLKELKRRWFHQILPLLEEYFADDTKSLRKVIGKHWENTVAQKDHDAFVPIQPHEMDQTDFLSAMKVLSSAAKLENPPVSGEEE